jgi:hypothetical protein
MDASTTSPQDAVPKDPEKGILTEPEVISTSSFIAPSSPLQVPKVVLQSTLIKWNQKIENLAGLEARGITRVLPSERHGESLLGDFQMAFLWFSANITANNLAVGFLGPLLFELGFVDSALCAVFGGLVGCMMTAYMSMWGAPSGSRTMVQIRLSILLSC